MLPSWVIGLRSGWSRRHPVGRLFLGYLVVALALAWELVVPGRALYRWDTLLYNWPVIAEARALILAGRWPFWASAFCCGTPLLENINAGVLYPPRLLCWLLPLRPGYQLFLFLHVWLSLVGMHVLVRRGLRLGPVAAFAGALAYAAGGYARGMWDTHNFMALPWVPLGLAALLEARRPGRWAGAALLTALSWSMMVLCGDFQAACFWFPVALLAAAFFPERRRLVAVLVGATALAALLTAPQWLATVVGSSETYRSGGLPFGEAVERSFHPLRLVELLFPNAFGNRDQWFGAGLSVPGSLRVTPWTASFHIGALLMLPAVLAFRHVRRPIVLWALAVLVGSVALAFGYFLPGYRWWLKLPLAGWFRYPEKYLLWATLALSVLAAVGTPALQSILRRARFRAVRLRWLPAWALLVAGTACVASVGLRIISIEPGAATGWIVRRGAAAGVVVLLLLVIGLRRPAVRARWILPVLFLVDVMLPWYSELVTTSRFDPLGPPAVVAPILNAGPPGGRFLRDPETHRRLVPPWIGSLSPGEAAVAADRELLGYNSARLWGLRTAAGFSPSESSHMRAYRKGLVEREPGEVVGVEDLRAFCRDTAVEWLLTTSGRAAELGEDGTGFDIAASWGEDGDLVLLRMKDAADVEVVSASASPPRMANMWRARPGFLRVDLLPGEDANILVKESYARGWRAEDEFGNRLTTLPLNEAFLGVRVPAGTCQVRLRYEPLGWGVGLGLALLGFLLAAGLAVPALGAAGLRRLAAGPWGAAALAGLLFLAVGTLARNHWGCAFDEGFHLARGVALMETGDSRMSYFHPPLQNLCGAYFADLAFGDTVQLPDTGPWRSAELFGYSAEAAALNWRIYPELVRASRWGSVIFGLLLCVVAVFWARRAAGVAAGWLAAVGVALYPSFLVHGNLNTTDMGVAALAVAGTYAAWCFQRGAGYRALWWATLAFVLAAVTKFSGLIWLATWALVCVPLFAAARRDARILGFWVAAAVLLAGVVLGLYGWEPQILRAGGAGWMGRAVPAGRYLEGLFVQGDHALTGQRSFFAGHQFVRGGWWQTPAAVALKTPVPWLVAMLLAAGAWVFRRRSWHSLVAWAPALVFAFMLLVANRLAIGVRHALPLVALGLVGAAVWSARLTNTILRRGVIYTLTASAYLSASWSYPHYVSYYSLPAGGEESGYRWSVDSNYDWGQDVEVLEEHWGALVSVGRGRPPDLIYFGFVDPQTIYRLPTGPNSWRGFMHRMAMAARGQEAYARWLTDLSDHEGTVVASISALALGPYGMDLTPVADGRFMGRIGHSFFVYHLPEAGEE